MPKKTLPPKTTKQPTPHPPHPPKPPKKQTNKSTQPIKRGI